MQQALEEVEVLMAQGHVQPEALSQQGLGSGWSPTAEHGIHRVARGNTQKQKHQRGNQPEHYWRQGQARCAVAQ